MVRFILVRHGQTEWNRVERFRGRADLALDETGIAQAEAVAQRLAGLSVSTIYSSPLRRTLMTADILGRGLDAPVHALDGLIDIDFGRFQGLSPEEASERYGDVYRQWLESPQEVRFPRGESLGDVRERVTAAVSSLTPEHDGATVVLVSHKVVCQVLLCAMLGLDNSHFWNVAQDVCAVNIFEMRGEWPVVTLLNDVCHLGSLR